MLKVVASVVANERQHGHGVVAQGTDLAFGGSRLAGGQQGADHGAMVPAEGFRHQRHSIGAAAAEQNGVDLNAVSVFELGCDDRALFNRNRIAGVRVSGISVRFGGPVITVPVDEVSWLFLGHAFPPNVTIVGHGNVGEHGVARFHGAHGNGVRIVVRTRGHTEEPVFGVDGVQTIRPQVHPGDVVAHHFGLPAGNGGGNHGEVRLAACRREGCCHTIALALRGGELQDEHVLRHPAFFLSHNGGDTQGKALLSQDGIATIAGTIGPNLFGFWEVGNVLGVIAGPRHILFARL